MATTRPRQTAANNEVLALTKKAMNAKVYKAVSAIVNTDSDEAALYYLGSFFRSDALTAIRGLAAEVDKIRAARNAK